MSANLRMNSKRITRLTNVPAYDGEATNKKYIDVKLNDKVNKNDLNGYLKLDVTSQMQGNLVMNDKRITGLTNPPNADVEATNKKYVDTHFSNSSIKPSHTPKNVFQYLMDDVNEWSTEYNVIVGSFSDLPESPRSWDKKVLNITPVKSGSNYRFRLGLQMFRMKTNELYSLIIELYNRDYETWQRQKTFVNGTGMWVRDSNTTEHQYHYGSST